MFAQSVANLLLTYVQIITKISQAALLHYGLFSRIIISIRFSYLQRAALGLSQGFVISFLESSTGGWAMLQLLCSQAREKLQEELLEKK